MTLAHGAGLSVTRRERVLEITIDRPPVNAIDAATSRRMGALFAEFDADPDLLVAIVTGAGDRVFSAGWDLKAAVERGENERTNNGVGGFAGLTQAFDLTKPVIAAVNGLAIGGGFELALACDLIVAADAAVFRLPETSLGVMADAGGVQRLPRRLPHAIAMELLLTGRDLSAAEAARWGLVNRTVPGAELMTTVRTMADEIAHGAPLAIRAIKEVVREIEGRSVRQAFSLMRTRTDRFPIYARMLDSDDREEGPRAFLEKRPPVFKGR